MTIQLLCCRRRRVIEYLYGVIQSGAMANAVLDSRSRRAAAEFATQFSIGCSVVLGPCMLGLRPWAGAGQLLALIFSLVSFTDFCRAIFSREKMNGCSLNLWDEAIAFSGCSYLLHALIRYQT
jgi:hypothetical protein